jgi:hypothetical protein
MKRLSKWRNTAIIVGSGVVLSGCQAWKIEPRPVPSVVQDQQNGKVALTMNDLSWVVLHNPMIENDSVIGMRTSGSTFGKSRSAFPINSVRSAETRQFSLRRTVGLAVAIALIPVVAYVSYFDF